MRSDHVDTLWLSAAAILLACLGHSPAIADHTEFREAFLDGANSWPGSDDDAGIYGQGFSPGVDATPDPGHSAADLVALDRFTFFKDGRTDSAANIKLAIFSNFFLNLVDLSTSRFEFVGISTNTIASTMGLSVGEPYTFEFASLPLEYGFDYGAIFVNDDGTGNLTPVKVSALTADYEENPPGSGVWLPSANYGNSLDYQYSTSNYINSNEFGEFLVAFSESGDAKFEAVFDMDDTGAGLAGDYNGNDQVEQGDLDLVLLNWGAPWPPEVEGWINDPPTDGAIDQDDLDGVLLKWGTSAVPPNAAAVPEPGSAVLVLVCGLSLIARRPLRRNYDLV